MTQSFSLVYLSCGVLVDLVGARHQEPISSVYPVRIDRVEKTRPSQDATREYLGGVPPERTGGFPLKGRVDCRVIFVGKEKERLGFTTSEALGFRDAMCSPHADCNCKTR